MSNTWKRYASYVVKRRMRNDLLPAALQTLSGELFFSELKMGPSG